MPIIDIPEGAQPMSREQLKRYAPTPKMAQALWVGAIGVVAVLAADWLGLVDVRPAAAGLFVLVVTEAGGWLKRDASSPGPSDE